MESKGKLVRWYEERGFGFIESASIDGDVFIHISALKTMSCEPKVGDVIYFKAVIDKSGKKKAENARIVGVAAKAKNNSRSKNNKFKVSILIAMFFAAGISVYQTFLVSPESISKTFDEISPASNSATLDEVNGEEDLIGYSCEGKQYCNEMISCDEAIYYLRNCPNVKIDGDRDGVPCESQWCS